MPETQETRVRSLGREGPLEKEMATHPGILAWEIPWTEEPGGLRSMGLQRVRHDLATKQQRQGRGEGSGQAVDQDHLWAWPRGLVFKNQRGWRVD